MSITKEQMVRDFRLCGIKAGDIILMHSALSAIGHVEGGADAVIDALLEVLTPEGTLAVVAMHNGVFDAATSPSAVGIISETVRRRPNAVRSLRHCHSVAAIGRLSGYFTVGHENCETNCGKGSPYDKIRELGGKIVLLGVDMNRNTTLHALEDFADAPYLVSDYPVPAPTYMKDYEGKQILLKKFPPGHRDFLRFTPSLRRADAMTEGRVGNAVVKVIDAKKMYELGLAHLAENINFFLCENKKCNFCKDFNGGV